MLKIIYQYGALGALWLAPRKTSESVGENTKYVKSRWLNYMLYSLGVASTVNSLLEKQWCNEHQAGRVPYRVGLPISGCEISGDFWGKAWGWWGL